MFCTWKVKVAKGDGPDNTAIRSQYGDQLVLHRVRVLRRIDRVRWEELLILALELMEEGHEEETTHHVEFCATWAC